ncbi:hypothetical protein EKO27_g10384 [Xylaria grammica]|uniref:Thaumatin-like protein n=1 Tax=Xylaria grammica TaxID=363999 RepID=A0A439CRC4_9PEZI|nr:hypothetical protein EKO27_g10384 [Xylaria grammica]
MLFGIRTALLSMSVPALLALSSPTPTSSRHRHSVRNEPLPTPAPTTVINPETLSRGEYVVTLVNSHTAAISTAHNQNVGSPTALQDGGSVLEANATAIFAVPTNWAGRVAMAEAGVAIRDRASLLEGSFIVQEGLTKARIVFDVSYVDGFTVPIVCECGGSVVLGCNLNLLNMCPDEYRLNEGTCMNPLRDTGDHAKNFFKECSALAYTFPTDDRATINGILGCESRIRCCVGTACPPHPRQVLCPAADGTAMRCPEPDSSQSRNTSVVSMSHKQM